MDRATSACHIDEMEVTRQESGPDPTLLQVDPLLGASLDREDLRLENEQCTGEGIADDRCTGAKFGCGEFKN
jgi:hypothetical protein